ncbi:hypothetical protein RhiirA5_395985 [Rhizophagus irregularis]|uniref:Ion transport domain-containing protein n=2 Tax=Rhizophagus irregularis TaxID=588596 RepID=A0A2N0Q478_9GLOM|nr:hypothetical protein RhiirA5_395985 [Rhizophagus irregularis]
MDEIEVETQNNTSASETKIDISDIKDHREEIEKTPSETKDDIFVKTKEHRKSISKIFVSQYMDDTEYGSDDYVVTYSEKDKSVLGWSIKENGPQQPDPDVYFKVDQIVEKNEFFFDEIIYIVIVGLIDLNDDRTSSSKPFLQLNHPANSGHSNVDDIDNIGFFPNGDLVRVSLSDRKIYKYLITDKPKNTDPWKISQINDIDIPESLYIRDTRLCRTKLFLLGGCPLEFITLKDNSERLAIYSDDVKLVDPYQAYDEIDISDDFNYTTSVITKLNKKIFIYDDKVCVTNGLDENEIRQNKTINRNSIYTLSTFKFIQSMLKEIIDKANIEKVASSEETVLKEVEVKNMGLCKLVLRTHSSNYDELSLVKENGHTESFFCTSHILSHKPLNSQDLVLIKMHGVDIYAMNEDGSIYDTYFINEHYKPFFRKILNNEFGESKHSIPLPKLTKQIGELWSKEEILEDVINDNLVSSKFGIEMLEIVIKEKYDDVARQIITNLSSKFGIKMLRIAIKQKYDDVVLQIINKTIESIQDYSENYMTSISLNLSELCDRYPDFIIKYISYTSIILSPFCNGIRNSKNTSLHSYTNVYIKESDIDNNVFKSISALYKGLIRHLKNLKIEEEIQTVSLIVPFPRICVYKDDHEIDDNHDDKSKIITILKKMIIRLMMIPKKSGNPWNEFLFKPKSILFCNIDSNHLYNWWNFAAIIDFKWKTFGRGYYYLIWVIESFGIYFAIIIGVAKKVFPFIVLLFFIVLGYAQAFFIVLRSNSINDDNDPQNLATKYDFVNPDGTITNTTIIQDPDPNTNLFNWFPTSLLAVYNLLTGDSGSLSSFTYREHSIMTILLVTFTFFTVIYLMNLFIGLLNLAIDDFNKKEEFLLQKAQIIMEIELFYLLPWQRNNKKWFPDWIYYDIPITKIRKLINAIDNKQTVFNYPPFISEKLRKVVGLTDDNNKLERKIDQTKEELTKQNVELKQQMECIMKYIGIEQDNKKEKDSEEKQYSEEEQDSKEDIKKKQDNKLEKQIKQTKEELTRELKEKMNKIEQKMEEKMDKIEQKMESIMKSLSKIK